SDQRDACREPGGPPVADGDVRADAAGADRKAAVDRAAHSPPVEVEGDVAGGDPDGIAGGAGDGDVAGEHIASGLADRDRAGPTRDSDSPVARAAGRDLVEDLVERASGAR